MTAVILLQPAQDAAWSILPGTYPTFADARAMAEIIRPSHGPDASFAIEAIDNVTRKGWLRA